VSATNGLCFTHSCNGGWGYTTFSKCLSRCHLHESLIWVCDLVVGGGGLSATCFIYEVMFEEELYLAAFCLENFRKLSFEFCRMEFRPLFKYKGVPFWKYIIFILHNSDMPPNILFVNNRSLVNSILTLLLSFYIYIYIYIYIFVYMCVCVCIYASADFKLVLNELCGPPVDWSWPALGYLHAFEGSR